MKSFDPVKVSPCKNCGSTINQYNPDSLTIICSHCGTSTGDRAPQKDNTKSYKAPKNPLFKLYDTFEYDSKTWQIIGCIRYRGKVREWDSEDNTWESTPWKYNSWWVINEARELAWISQDQSGYKWSRKTTVTSSIPEHDRAYEHGSWTITSAVGEFSYFPSIGGRTMTHEKKGSSIEVLLDENGNKKEIEAFYSTPIKPMALFSMFNKPEIASGLKRFKTARNAVIASIICLAIGYFVLSQNTNHLLTIKSTPVEATFYKPSLIGLGDISLKKNSLVEFSLQASPLPRGNGSFDAELVIKDHDNVVVSQLPISLWRASGYDSDGSWTESTKAVSPRLKLPPKSYQLFLQPIQFKQWKKLSFRGKVKENVPATLPLIIGGILLIVLFIYLNISRFKFIRKQMGSGV